MLSTNELWKNKEEKEWLNALNRYWSFVKPTHLEIEKEFDSIHADQVKNMNPKHWYEFLLTKYFFWKYTAPNRYKTTTNQLKKYLGPDDSLDNLFQIKEQIFNIDKEDIATGLKTANKIRGLGPPGASGLLAVLFPSYFATVDQFAVKALSEINGLPEKSLISVINPNQITIKEGVTLINIMKEKATKLNAEFQTFFWNPRKIDMVLWVSAR